MGVRIIIAAGLLGVTAFAAAPSRAAQHSSEDALAEAMNVALCKGDAARKEELRLEKEAAELRRASEEAMLRRRREAEEIQEAVDLARSSEISVPVAARPRPLDGRLEAARLVTIARTVCAVPARDYAKDLAQMDWAAFQRVNDLELYSAGLSPCEARVFLRLVDRGHTWKPGTVIGPEAALPPTR